MWLNSRFAFYHSNYRGFPISTNGTLDQFIPGEQKAVCHWTEWIEIHQSNVILHNMNNILCGILQCVGM